MVAGGEAHAIWFVLDHMKSMPAPMRQRIMKAGLLAPCVSEMCAKKEGELGERAQLGECLLCNIGT